MRTPIHVFLPSFAEILKAEVTKWVRGIHHENVGIFPFVWSFWSDLAESFSGSLFLRSASVRQVLSKSVQFTRRYVGKLSFRLITISA